LRWVRREKRMFAGGGGVEEGNMGCVAKRTTGVSDKEKRGSRERVRKGEEGVVEGRETIGK